ncbi:hypothetical protein [Venatoribacter cucullus]|uniref:hypothetical protein n=1 Tax=Venatoribacter cucullus TaxID=2661630 RepID=UPI00223E9016|nr:hypothetical protein [Venatoribacter cucullus]
MRTPLARVPADPRLPKPITHTRPRGIHAPTRSFGVIQTMLLALPNIGLERMGREKPQQFERILAACGRMFSFGFWFLVFGFWFLVFGFWFLVFGFWFLSFGFARAARYIQYCRRSRCGLNRAYSTPK